MEEAIAGGILLAVAKLAIGYLVLRLVWGTLDYIFSRPWLLWSLVGLVGAAVYATYAGLWPWVWDHAYLALVIPMGLMMVAGLVALAWDGIQWTAKQWRAYPQWAPVKRGAFWLTLAALVIAALGAGAYLTLERPLEWAWDNSRLVGWMVVGTGALCVRGLPEEWMRALGDEEEPEQQRDESDRAQG